MIGDPGRHAALARLVARRRLRWRVYLVLAVLLAILCVFPRPYISRATIVPQDTNNSAGLNAVMNLLGGQAQSFANLLGGGRATNDLYLIIGRSDAVAEDVIGQLKLVGPEARYATVDRARIALAKKVDVHLLLGGVMEIEATTHDADDAQRLTKAYLVAISRQLALFGRQVIVNKERIVNERFAAARGRVEATQAALDEFRRTNNLAEPTAQLGQTLTLRTQLQAQLQARQVELQALRQSQGPDNPQLQSVQTSIAALQAQIAATARPDIGQGGPNVAGLTRIGSRYLNLFRDAQFAQALYEVYARSVEQLAVEQLAAESASYVQVIDGAHLDAERHLNVSAVAALAALVLAIAFVEWYAPMTGLFRLGEPIAADRDPL